MKVFLKFFIPTPSVTDQSTEKSYSGVSPYSFFRSFGTYKSVEVSFPLYAGNAAGEFMSPTAPEETAATDAFAPTTSSTDEK